MRAGDLFGQTLREAPSDADIPSHRLLVRGGFIRRVSAGVYALLPLGVRVLERVTAIVREEMDRAGGTELHMPALNPADLWRRSGRWDAVDVLYRLTDRSDREWCLAPTHEEVVTALAATELPSYRDLPSIPYQVQWKFRDEPRPRGGLLRAREFLMKDAYSFDADEAGLEASYARVLEAYERVFARCGLSVRRIEAQAGMIGGSVNHEFAQPCPSGEDTFVACDGCDYAANTEAAVSRAASRYDFGDPPDVPTDVDTPGKATVEEVAAFLDVDQRRLVKALLFRTDHEVVCALVPGDRELNDEKLARLVGGRPRMLTDEEFRERNWAKGFSGPVGLDGVRLVADEALRDARNMVTGANAVDRHLVGVVPGRDFEPDAWADLVVARAGDACVRCGGTLHVERGIEVGHVFQLGSRYSKAMDATFTADDGSVRPFLMGCYGLGVSRVVASIVEAHHDDRGIVWPKAVAPFDVVVILLAKDDPSRACAERLHDELGARGVGVVLDDRSATSAGVKFGDADLVGYPLQVVVGKTYVNDGVVEATVRASGDRTALDPTADAVLAALESCP